MKPIESITVSWHVEDVLSRDPTMTREEAFEVLEAVKDNHDAEVGVNWQVIDEHIEQRRSDRK